MVNAIMDLNNLLSFVKKPKGSKSSEFNDTLDYLRSKVEVGLEDDELKSVFNVLTSSDFEKSSCYSFKTLLFACSPKGILSNQIVDLILLWMLSSYHKNSSMALKANAVLEWLNGLLDFNLVERTHVDSYYNLYYGLLEVHRLEKLTCKLIHRLTRPEDVFRGRVEKVYRCHLRNGRKKYTSTLLGLFKMLKPELVPENVIMWNSNNVFGKLTAQLSNVFELAQNRVASPSSVQQSNFCNLQWNGLISRKAHSAKSIIPGASYIHQGSELYCSKRRKVIDFLDKESLSCYQLTTDLPSCILSLLMNEGGIHFLATQNKEIHARFSYVLFSALNAAFFTNFKSYSYEDRDCLLEKLVCLEEYMQQGIPVVSRFLALYIASWNGLDHRNHIHRLLEFITFSSFEELSHCILSHLQTLFLSANTSEKCTIINTLKNVISNLIVANDSLHSTHIPPSHLFLGSERDWNLDFEATIPKLIEVVSDLCHQGLLFTSNHPVMLHTVLSFYESLLDIESKAGKSVSVFAPFVFYRAAFSKHFSAFSRACNLLIGYKELQDSRSKEQTWKGLQNPRWLNDYSCDIWNCFLNEKAFEKGEQGYVFQRDGDKLQDLIERDSAFILTSHPISKGLEFAIQENFTVPCEDLPDAVQFALRKAFPGIAKCLNAIGESYSNYHNIE